MFDIAIFLCNHARHMQLKIYGVGIMGVEKPSIIELRMKMFNRIVEFEGKPVDMGNLDDVQMISDSGIDPLNDRDVENHRIAFSLMDID